MTIGGSEDAVVTKSKTAYDNPFSTEETLNSFSGLGEPLSIILISIAHVTLVWI